MGVSRASSPRPAARKLAVAYPCKRLLPPVIPAKAGIQRAASAPGSARAPNVNAPYLNPAIPAIYPPVIPAKAGIQKPANSLAARNQAPSAANGSLLP